MVFLKQSAAGHRAPQPRSQAAQRAARYSTPVQVAAVEGEISETSAAINRGVEDAQLQQRVDSLEKTANETLRPYPHAEWRETMDKAGVILSLAGAGEAVLP